MHRRLSFVPLQKRSYSSRIVTGIPIPQIETLYQNISQNHGKGFSYAQKIIATHLANKQEAYNKQSQYIDLHPDRVALQDASGQTALLSFMLTGLPRTKIPTSMHCDHLIVANSKNQSAQLDLKDALGQNKEVFEFLNSASQKYGVGFHKPGSGIIHQIVLENYAFPGGLMIGTDSHTPNAGGLGMMAVGVGGADAVDGMSGIPWQLKNPKILGVKLTGELKGWASPKDIITKLVGILTVKGGTGKIIEYFGEGVESLSCTGMATICNMGAEVGATTSIFPYTNAMAKYLEATNRGEIAQVADSFSKYLQSDGSKVYDEVIEINLSELEPHINGPFTPDLSHAISQMKQVVPSKQYPQQLSAALIGSCTNSSYEDMTRAASIAKQAIAQGLKAKCEFLITPGSEQIRATMERDGLTSVFEQLGGTVLANACGPCIGQWQRHGMQNGQKNSIVCSFNRNFTARNDGNSETHTFITSPDVVTAMAIAGDLTFNPLTDSLSSKQGQEFRLQPPQGEQLPAKGFDQGDLDLYVAPLTTEEAAKVEVVVNPKSNRLELIKPFKQWDLKQDFTELPVLIKIKGKCTTDHISAAGAWLKYKGHLSNISQNTYMGAVNAENNQTNNVKNQYTGEYNTVPEVAKQYQSIGKHWIVVGDSNFGEGSARESAAMQPRFLGGAAIIVRSFARIHEGNLKKQGILPLVFSNPEDYDLIQPTDRITFENLEQHLQVGEPLPCTIVQQNGNRVTISLKHTLDAQQIQWFKAGSAMNFIAQQQK